MKGKLFHVVSVMMSVMMVIVLAGCCYGAATEQAEIDRSDWVKLDLTFANYLPKSDVDTTKMSYIYDALEKRMPGMVTVTEYWNGTLLAQDAMLDGIKSGTADIGYMDLGSVAGDFPLSQIWNFPSMPVESQVGGSAAFHEWARIAMPAEYNDFVFLYGNAGGPCSFVTTEPIANVGAIAGRQVRAVGAIQRTVQAVEAHPITMITGEVYEALRSGMLDGVYASFGSLARLSIVQDGITPYSQMVPLGSSVYAFVMNKDTFNRMPDSQKIEFMAAWDEAFWQGLLPNWEKNQPMSEPIILESAAAAKWTFIAPGTPEYQAYLDKTDYLLADYVKELNAMGFDGEAEVQKVKDSIDKWCAGWFNFERHIQPYKTSADGTYEQWSASYSIPDIHEHAEFTLK